MNQIKFGIGFQVDKAGLNELQKSLDKIQRTAQNAVGTDSMVKDLEEAGRAANQLSNILNQSWNSKLGQLDLSKVNKSIKETYGSVQNLKTAMVKGGSAGSAAYNQFASSVLNTNLQLKQSNKLLDEMATSMANTVKWGITSSIFNNISSSIQQAYGYTKKLDSSLNDIRIVTDKSAESMEKFARQANSAAKGLGASTLDYTDASLIYYQQGLNNDEVAARAETTLKAANVTGQTGEEVSEQLTAVWNGYKVTAQEAELYVDKLAAVAASTASDLEELSTGMSKVASAANAMGVDVDQLNAQLATIVSVTRQAPESVGTALKTIYARMSDLKLGGTDEDGLGLGDVSGTMEKMGISIMDETGNLRDMGTVIEEVAVKWDTWSEAQKTAMAQVMAGKRQYNNLVALFENWDMYTDALNTSANAAGTLQHQQDIYMESTEAHLQQLRTEAEKTYDILFDQELVNGFADALKGVLGIFNNFLDVTGGGLNSLITLGTMLGSVFQKQIGDGISKVLDNRAAGKENEARTQAVIDVTKAGYDSSKTSGLEPTAETYARQTENARELLAISKNISSEKYNELNALRQQIMEEELIVAAAYEYQEAKDKASMEGRDYNKELTNDLKNQIKATREVQKAQNDIRIACEKINEETAQGLVYEEEKEARLKQQQIIYSQLELLSEYEGANEQEKVFHAQILEKIRNNELLDKEELTQLQQSINNLVDAQIAKEERLKRLKEAQALIDKGELYGKERSVAVLNQDYNQRINNEKKSQGVQNLTGTLMDSISLISMAGGAISTLGDESVDAGEKLSQLFSTFVMSIPSMLSWGNNIKNLKGDLPVIAAGVSKYATALSGSGQAASAAALAQGGLGASLATLGSSIGTIIVAIGPYLLILAALVGAIWLCVKAYNADADAAKKSAEAAKEAAAAAQEAKQAYEDLKNTISGYEDAVKAMEELTKGTQEYEEALTEANKKAMELMKNNPELAEKSYREDGLIKFQDGALESYEKEEFEKANKAAGRSNIAEVKANQDQLTLDRTLLLREENISATEYIEGGESYRYLSNEELKEVIDLINKNNGTLLEQDLEKLENIPKILIPEIMASKEAILKLAEKTAQLETINQRLYEESMRISLEDVGAFKESDSQLVRDTITSLYTKGFDENEQKELNDKADKHIKTLENDGKWGDNKLHEEYARIKGLTVAGDKIGKGIYLDKNGEQVSVDDEAAIEVIKQNYIQEYMASYDLEKRGEITKTVTDMAKVAKDLAQGNQELSETLETELLGFLSGEDTSFDFAKLSPEQIENLKNQFEQGVFNNIDFSNTAYENADQFAYALNTALSNYDASAYWNRQAEQAKAAFVSVTESLSVLQTGGELNDEQIAYLETLEEKYKELGAIRNRSGAEYLALLEEIQEIEEENYTIALENSLDLSKERYKEAIDKRNNDEAGEVVRRYNGSTLEEEVVEEVDVVANIDAVTEAMEEVFDQKYEIEVAITDDLITDVDNIINKTDKLAEAVEKVGDGFQLAAEDAESILDVFPELALGAEVLADGTIQLSNSTTEAVLGGYADQIDADTAKTEAALENRITELEAARAQVLREIEFLETEAKTEEDIQKSVDRMNELSAEFQTELSAATAEDEVANSAASARAVIDNWAAKEAAAMAYAETAAEAEDEGHVVSGPKVGNVKNQVRDTAETQNTTKDVERTPEEAIEEQRQAALSNANALLDSYNGQIADLTVALSKLRKGAQNIADAASGEGDSSSGSGSGGGSEETRDAQFKLEEEEIDRYWEFNRAIENIAEVLSDLEKVQSKLHGKQLIASLKQENELLEHQAKAYEKLADEQKREAEELQSSLSASGVGFDSEGAIMNYTAASYDALNKYNEAVAAYNSFAIDEATFQAAETAYETFKSQLDRYETLYYDEMVETQNKLDDIKTQQIENNLKIWETELQIVLDLQEAEREWNTFLKDINDDFKAQFKDLGQELATALSNVKTYVNLDKIDDNTGTYEGTIGTDIKAMQDIMAEIDNLKIEGGTSDMFSSMTEAQEKLKELIEQSMTDAEDLFGLYQDAWDAYMEGIEQSADKFDELMGKFELIDGELEYQGELIELIYGEEAYKLLDTLYSAQEKNTFKQIESLQQQKNMWYDLWQNAEEGSEEQTKYYDLWTEAQENLNNKVIEYIELLKTDYSNTIDDILKELETKLSNGSSFNDIADEWDHITEKADTYLDNVEELYELQSLANKINESIDNTSSLKNQQKLQEFRDRELKALREKEKLTQYDLDAADARYQIMLKEIALEDAQNAKNSMKLTRGVDGNWSYQYVADEEQTENAQQELLDAYNNYYQLADQAYTNNLQKMQELNQAYLDSIREIMNSEVLSEEEKQIRIEELRARYEENYKLLVQDNTKIRDDLAISSSGLLTELFQQDEENYKQMTENEKALVDALVESNKTNFLDLEEAIKTNFDNIREKAETVMSGMSEIWDSEAQGMIQNYDDIQYAVESAYEALRDASEEYQDKIRETADAAEDDFSNIESAIVSVEDATDSLTDATANLVSETEAGLASYKDTVQEIEDMWYSVKDAIEEALSAARAYANLEPPDPPSFSAPNSYYSSGSANKYSSGRGSKSGSSGGSGSRGSGGSSAPKIARFLSGGYGYGVYSFSLNGSKFFTGGEYGYLSSYARSALKGAGYTHYTLDGKNQTALKTGGYTGSWTDGNPEQDNGKLAWLHQKELVLNATDTQNILDAVQTIRNLSNLSSSIEDMIMRNLSSMIVKIANVGTNVNYSTENSQQSSNNTFNITAQFPNANDVTSIREAILSLPNIASQYIFENKK